MGAFSHLNQPVDLDKGKVSPSLSKDRAYKLAHEELTMRGKANEIADQSLEATRRIKLMAMESRALASATNEVLHGQGEILDRVEAELHYQNDTMKKAEHTLTNMEKCCGMCICPWAWRRSYESGKKYRKAYKKGDKGPSPPGHEAAAAAVVTAQPEETCMASPAPAGRVQMKKVLNDYREHEMELNLNDVSDILDELRHQALSMSAELEKQNTQLTKIDVKAEVNAARIAKANQRTTVLLAKA